MNAFWIFLCYS